MDMSSIGKNYPNMNKSTLDQLQSKVELIEKEQRSMRRQLVNLIIKYNQMSYEQTMDNRNRVGHRHAEVDG